MSASARGVLRSVPVASGLGFLAFVSAATSAIALDRPSSESSRRWAWGRAPFHFERNAGQLDGSVLYYAQDSGDRLLLTRDEAILRLEKPGRIAAAEPWATVRLRADGANPRPEVVAEGELPGRSHYLRGNRPAEWRTDVPHHARVRYRDVYPDIDLVYHGREGRLEYDWVVAPGADPGRIRQRFVGAERVVLDVAGDLVIHTPDLSFRQRRPVLYQEVEGERLAVEGGYVLHEDGALGYRVRGYDPRRPLVIDPVIEYRQLLGGSLTSEGRAIAVDSLGNAYVTGFTNSLDFPTVDPLPGGTSGNVFVSKLGPDGTLLFSTYIGGSLSSSPFTIAVDAAGEVYVAGQTSATDFPLVNAYQSTRRGASDGFVLKLSIDGKALVYSTLLGGSSTDLVAGLALDGDGNAYVTGKTESADFPLLRQARVGVIGATRAFVSKLAVAGNALVYSQHIGGTDGAPSEGAAIAVDTAGNAYVAGTTEAAAWPPLVRRVLGLRGGGADAFVIKVSPAGNLFPWLTYLGGSSNDGARALAVDAGGFAHVAGVTTSADFPTVNALQPVFPGGTAGFVTKIAASGESLAFSTFLGGNNATTATAVAVDLLGHAYVAGHTSSTNFPVPVDAPDPLLCVGSRAYGIKLHRDGAALGYGVDLSGCLLAPALENHDQVGGIAANDAGDLFVVGSGQRDQGPSLPDQFFAFVQRVSHSNDAVQLVSSLNPSQVGETVTFTATVDGFAPTGTVTFADGSVDLGTAPLVDRRATLTLSSLTEGTHTIVARYSGDGANPASDSAPLAQVVDPPPVPTTISLTVDPSNALLSSTITLTATVTGSTPTGNVTFRNGAADFATAPLVGGVATTTRSGLSEGTYDLTASYPGDRFNLPSSSPNVQLFVNGPPRVAFTAPPAGASFNAPASITFTVDTTAGPGTSITRVEFFNGAILVGTATVPPFTFVWSNVPLGNYLVTAKAFDGLGQSATTPPLAVKVKFPTLPGERVTFLHNDAGGSAIGASDESGALLWRESYRPYGERLRNEPAADANRQFFHGKPRDQETGLQYFGARYYDPVVGRFLSMDPAAFAENNVHSLNRYAYANNNPYRYRDPDGQAGQAILALSVLTLGYVAITGSLPRLGGFQAAPKTEAIPGFGVDPSASAGSVLTTPGEAVPPVLLPGFGALIKTVADLLIFSQSSTSGENKFTAAGRQAHEQEQLPAGFQRDVPIPGTRLRMDGYNPETKQVLELKPNNPRQIRRGERQVEHYCAECDKSSLGPGHSSVPVQTYDPKKYRE